MEERASAEAATQAIEDHIRGYFQGHAIDIVHHRFSRRRRKSLPALRIAVISPGPQINCWAYITIGCWAAAQQHGHGLEFIITAKAHDQRFLELAAINAYYHVSHHLDVGHSAPIGEPWTPGSACDHLLVSLPYLHGSDLEHCAFSGGHARLLWLLPVTAAEIAFRRQNGTEALEQLFEDTEIDPNDLHRSSVA